MDLENEWEDFLMDDFSNEERENTLITDKKEIEHQELLNCPEPTNIYISTKSKITYLTKSTINLCDLFWKIPIIPYNKATNGVIKKQIKINSNNYEELNSLKEKLKNYEYYTEQVITSIDNPTGRIKFKDIRKINIGISSKDIISYRIKQKSAFYNCFVLIMRLEIDDVFKEFHVKIFNTGKVEIPGIQNDEMYRKILNNIILILTPHIKDISFMDRPDETILINSNFNCGYYINREKLHYIIRTKYKLQTIFDPCSYPGIQCKFYYNPEAKEQTGMLPNKGDKTCVKVSFMIFRTGSILIVGKCNEDTLYIVYKFIAKMLRDEFGEISLSIIDKTDENIIKKKPKLRRKLIHIETPIG